MDREKHILSLRPSINTIDKEKNMSPEEIFQNNTLRPILKFQNDILIELIKSNNHYTSLLKEINSDKDSLLAIKDFFNKETQLKLTITGVIIGLFSIEELAFYNQNSKELNKRIIQMVAQRFFDNNNF